MSIPIHLVPKFVAEATRLVEAEVPGIRVVAFGHVGDGNVHFNLSQPVGMDRATYAQHREQLSHLVHDLAMSLAAASAPSTASVSSSGRNLSAIDPPSSFSVMRKIKAALDPLGLMNPGKVL